VSRHLFLALLTILLPSSVLTGCSSGSSNYIREQAAAKKNVVTSGLRSTIAEQLLKAKRYRVQGDLKQAVMALRIAAFFGKRLHDDILIRHALTRFPGGALPPELRRTRIIMLAQKAFAVGNLNEVKALLASFTAGTNPITRSRADILKALSEVETRPDFARHRLIKAANRPIAGPMGLDLRALARLTAASIDYDREHYSKAIRGYLRVPEESRYNRLAQLGLAWCQFQVKRPERTIAILKRLPGGVTADPEVAFLAAVAVHLAGSATNATLVVDSILTRPTKWNASITPKKVLALVRTPSPSSAASDPVLSLIVSDSRVQRLAHEINATGAELASPARDWYLSKVRHRFEKALADAQEKLSKRMESALNRLRVLRPQLK
jgi:hypothetical protein